MLLLVMYHVLFIGLPCSLNNGGCNHRCTDTLSGPLCSCYDGGYVLLNNRKTCAGQYLSLFSSTIESDCVNVVDMNECTLFRGICGSRAKCFNQRGSYTCQCYNGYQRRNGTCEGIGIYN